MIALHRQTVLPKIYIVDDGNEHEYEEFASWSFVVKYIFNRPDGLYHRVGKFNEAMRLVSGATILLDDDCLIQGDRYVEAFEEGLARHNVVRGLFLDEGEYKLPPWFSTTNLGLYQPHLFDSAYDGRYGFEDTDMERELLRDGWTISTGDERTAVKHVGQPFSGDRVATQLNEKVYREKWGL